MDLSQFWFSGGADQYQVAPDTSYTSADYWTGDFAGGNAGQILAAPSSSWTGFQLTPASIMNAAQGIGSTVASIASLSLAKDKYQADRDIAKANLDAGVQIAKYNAAGSAAKAAGAARREEFAANLMPTSRTMSPLLMIALVAGAIYLANQK
jgi:hypothetical protein